MKITAIIAVYIAMAMAAANTKAEVIISNPVGANDTLSISVNLNDRSELTQFNQVEFTASGSVKSQVDNTLNQLEYIQRDNDLVISMPLTDTFEHSFIEGVNTKTLTNNQVLHRNDGVVHDGVTVVSGRNLTTALHFSQGHVYSPLYGLNLEQVRQTGYSYSAWIKPGSVTGEQAIALSGVRWQRTNWLHLAQDKIAFEYYSDQGNGAKAVGTTPLDVNQWYHVAAVYDPYAQQIRVYLDGQLEASSPLAGAFGYKIYGLDLYLGRDPAREFPFFGDISDVQMFTRPLSDDYIRDTHAGTLYSGSMTSLPIALPASAEPNYNRIKLNIAETNAGTSQAYLWQNDNWQRLYPSSFKMLDSESLSDFISRRSDLIMVIPY